MVVQCKLLHQKNQYVLNLNSCLVYVSFSIDLNELFTLNHSDFFVSVLLLSNNTLTMVWRQLNKHQNLTVCVTWGWLCNRMGRTLRKTQGTQTVKLYIVYMGCRLACNGINSVPLWGVIELKTYKPCNTGWFCRT